MRLGAGSAGAATWAAKGAIKTAKTKIKKHAIRMRQLHSAAWTSDVELYLRVTGPALSISPRWDGTQVNFDFRADQPARTRTDGLVSELLFD